jgi:diguanylate cyclase (GGDEF)-like protein
MTRHVPAETAHDSPRGAEIEGLKERLQRAVDACGKDIEAQRRLLEEALALADAAQRRIFEHRTRIAQLESLSVTDELTHLLNRRGLREELSRTLARAGRYGECGALVLIDLDSFKAVNDGLGHLAGDRVLRFVAGLLRGSVRCTDFVARIGGDEFVVVLTNTTAEQACHRAQALERLINRGSVTWKSARIQIRASVGVASFGPEEDQEALLHRADLAMYQRKTGGIRAAA